MPKLVFPKSVYQCRREPVSTSARAKEYHSDLKQVISITTPKSKTELQWIVFLKCRDHVGTS